MTGQNTARLGYPAAFTTHYPSHESSQQGVRVYPQLSPPCLWRPPKPAGWRSRPSQAEGVEMERVRRHGGFTFACALAMILLAGAGSAFAQGQGNATLTGTIVDNVGVVPGATVTATQIGTDVSRTATTNDQG